MLDLGSAYEKLGLMHEMTLADLQELQGRWVQVRFEENGIVNPPDIHAAHGAVLTIEGCNFHVGVPGHRTILEGAFMLDACVAPKAITWIDAIGEDAGKAFPSIYELSEGRFTFLAADTYGSPDVFYRRDRLHA